MRDFLKDKRVLVTGACGTVGRELVRQLLEDCDVRELIGVENNESELFFLAHAFSGYSHANFSLGDIRDKDKMLRISRGVHVVFHSAAYKHVALCEQSPFEAVQTNILGVQNIISAAHENNVQKVVFTSSDKAVNPTNVMGTSKLMGERLITAANANQLDGGPVFLSTRFGNVLGSRGSVIPIFEQQIKQGGPLTLTASEMTRFIMSIREAVRLVIDSSLFAKGGEVLITKMPVIRIQDLAEVMIGELASEFGRRPEEIDIRIIGPKPGEKMYEELMSGEETRRAWELERYFVVFPAFPSLYREIDYGYDNVVSRTVDNPYNSSLQTPLSQQELRSFLHENRLLHPLSGQEHPDERNFP